MKDQEIKPIRIYEYIDKEDEFKEIEKRLPLYDNLDPDKIFLFVDLTRRRVWLWRGSNTTPQMKSLATRSLETHFIRVSSSYNESLKKHISLELETRIINEGKEPTDFKKRMMFGTR